MGAEQAAAVTAWLALAEADVRVAAMTLAAADLSAEMAGIAAFHAQQAAEKALKAALSTRHMGIPRTHDTSWLLGLVAPQAPADIELACALLAEYGVGPRYPGFAPTLSATEARDALAAAHLVLAWVDTLVAPAAQK